MLGALPLGAPPQAANSAGRTCRSFAVANITRHACATGPQASAQGGPACSGTSSHRSDHPGGRPATESVLGLIFSLARDTCGCAVRLSGRPRPAPEPGSRLRAISRIMTCGCTIGPRGSTGRNAQQAPPQLPVRPPLQVLPPHGLHTEHTSHTLTASPCTRIHS